MALHTKDDGVSSEVAEIIDLARENAELCERIAQLAPFREMVKVAVDQLAERDREIGRLSRQSAALREELRAAERQVGR